jgi:uncharacterized protein YehS (DUF1456 family)
MRNDDVIKSIRYMLDISDAKIAEILKLGGYQPTRDEVAAIFHDEVEGEEKEDISHQMMAHFLDGLIYFKRGKSDKHPPRPITIPVSNNTVLKKMRVAFKLREEDIRKILQLAGFSIPSSELNALFRDKKHRNYKPCGDQILRYFLKGMTLKLRGE